MPLTKSKAELYKREQKFFYKIFTDSPQNNHHFSVHKYQHD